MVSYCMFMYTDLNRTRLFLLLKAPEKPSIEDVTVEARGQLTVTLGGRSRWNGPPSHFTLRAQPVGVSTRMAANSAEVHCSSFKTRGEPVKCRIGVLLSSMQYSITASACRKQVLPQDEQYPSIVCSEESTARSGKTWPNRKFLLRILCQIRRL